MVFAVQMHEPTRRAGRNPCRIPPYKRGVTGSNPVAPTRFTQVEEDRSLAGALSQDHGLVFASAIGTPLDRHNVRREFRKITQTAGLGTDWVPREMRHTFVSLLSSNGTALEDIADQVGHRGTTTTETVYRKVIVPELRRGAEVMDRLFN
jgi:site-specific recombinase XerD